MIGQPKFKMGDKVSFEASTGVIVTGTVYIVDAYGTFYQQDEPSYDILTANCLYKHLRESFLEKVEEV